MTFRELKNLAVQVVDESDYSDFAKQQMFNFIAETKNPSNIKSLILDEQVQDVSSDYDAQSVIDARFKAMVSEVEQVSEDSDKFLQIGRRVICNYLESVSEDYENYLDMASFVMYEASDYQILTTLMEDYIPEETYDVDYAPFLAESFAEFTGLPIVLEGDELRSAKDIGMEKARALTSPAAKTRAALKKFRGKPGKRALAHLARFGGKVGGKVKTKGTKYAKKVIGTRRVRAIQKFGVAHAKGLKRGGALAVAALVAFAAYKIYKRFTDQARRACAGSPDKAQCMANYRAKAVKAQISQLKSGMSQCGKSSNPSKCKQAIQTKITKLQAKM